MQFINLLPQASKGRYVIHRSVYLPVGFSAGVRKKLQTNMAEIFRKA